MAKVTALWQDDEQPFFGPGRADLPWLAFPGKRQSVLSLREMQGVSCVLAAVCSPRKDADLLDENMQPTISLLIGAAEQGDKAATEALFGTLYVELRRMAKRELGKRAGFVSISATTLLHEAYLDMSAREGQSFPDRARFMAYAARVMRTLDWGRPLNRKKM